jgi:MoxR-like ATPase
MTAAATDAGTGGQLNGADLLRAVQQDVVGRRLQIASCLAVLGAGRDLLLEGPPGTGKSTVLRSITRHRRIPLLFVEGNGDLTPAKLVGYHDPAQVMRHGYREEDFVHGPLPEAMRRGGFLFLEEFNRIPEDTLNVLLGAMAEREVNIPRYGVVRAEPDFRLVAAMNPYDSVGTMRVSVSIFDRLCRLAVDYQSEEEEREIVHRRTSSSHARLVEIAVSVTRAPRSHPALRTGSSVRGAIDFVLVAHELADLEERPDPFARDLLHTAGKLALSGKIMLDEGSANGTAEDVVAEILDAAA